jgi:hypothetical protein
MLEAPVWTALRIDDWRAARGATAFARSARSVDPATTLS